MNAIAYADVLRGCAQLCGFDAEALPLGEGRRMRDCLSRRLEMGWQAEFWPVLMAVEARLFAPGWVSGNGSSDYAAASHVWFNGSQQYYQALRAAPNNQAPATLVGGVWTANAGYWAAARFDAFQAQDWNAAVNYTAGLIVRSAVDGQNYQLYAATSLNEEPSANLTKWGLRTVLARSVDYDQPAASGGSIPTPIGEVACVWDAHPDRDARARRLRFVLRAGGLTVLATRGAGSGGLTGLQGTTSGVVDVVWVEFRLRAPVLFGEVFDPTAVYAVGDQVFYGSDTAGAGSYRGDFFGCVTATTAGESPASAGAKWARVEIPKFLRRYLERGGAADYLRGEGAGPVLEGDAAAELDRQVGLFRGEQSQWRETEVLSR